MALTYDRAVGRSLHGPTLAAVADSLPVTAGYADAVSPTRRDPDGTRRPETTWESLVERQIREAMADGRFDGLPHQGAPLPAEDDAAAGDWAMAYRMLRDAGMAPPWIESDKEAREGLHRLDALMDRATRARPAERDRLRSAMRSTVLATDRAIERVNAEAPTNRQHRARLDVDAELARLERAFPG